jgi:hypothetical protein
VAAGGVLSPLRSAGSGGRRRGAAAPGSRRPPEDASEEDEDDLEDFDPSPFMDAVIKGASHLPWERKALT